MKHNYIEMFFSLGAGSIFGAILTKVLEAWLGKKRTKADIAKIEADVEEKVSEQWRKLYQEVKNELNDFKKDFEDFKTKTNLSIEKYYLERKELKNRLKKYESNE